jgi:membrane-bound serine protease (ClpP class)
VAFAAVVTAAFGQSTDDTVTRKIALLAAIEGPIGPAATRHIEKVIEEAATRQAEVLILRLDTPGGLADAMRDIISEILTSPTPVVGYVAPPGAHAASAGTYILYATHVAAMAPGTNLGAATPVAIGGMPGAPPPEDKKPAGSDRPENDAGDGRPAEDDQGAEDRPLGERVRSLAPDEAMNAKATNDAVAFIRSLAEMHGRNADWAERAVREAASLSSAKALEQGVIDLVAADVDELLNAIDGRAVSINGTERVLATRGLPVEQIEMDAITRLLGVLSNPNVALLLMMIGVYGIIFEFWNPGAIAPGMVGAISLTLGLYSLNQLPLDYAGLALIVLGIGFMVAEAFTPTLGILGFGGLIAFVIGSAMLVDTDVPAYQVSWWMIGTMAVMSAAVLVLLLGYTLRAYRRAPISGSARMVGTQAKVLDWSGGGGFVWADGERWRATGATGLAPGASVQIRGIDGLALVVGPTGEDATGIVVEGAGAKRREGET